VLFAFLTTILWSFSAIFARKLIGTLGSTLANFSRLLLAAVLLAVWAFAFGHGLEGDGLRWYVLSGAIGFGLGDIALYFALPRIGSRLTLLLTQCLAAPLAVLVERLWLGTAIPGAELLAGAGILGGVSLALVPGNNQRQSVGSSWVGIGFGVLAALGQALGAVVSRHAFALSLASGARIDGGTAAFQRILGGVVCSGLAWWLWRNRADERGWSALRGQLGHGRFQGLLLASSLFGPVVGVGCYQWALATAPSGIVLPIVALCPIAVIPLSWWFEGDRPTPRSLLGGALAVASAVALAHLHSG
jgi:drug/metabolite transporter (DMT)-like permease